MAASFGWGTLAASSLVIGAIFALRFKISLRAIGLIMGFGAGVLISALSFDLIEEAVDKSSGHGWVVAGVFAGCLVFWGGNGVIDRLGGSQRKDADGSQEGDSPLAIVLGTVLDGIPRVDGDRTDDLRRRSGRRRLPGRGLHLISNLPESISSTSGLVTSGWKKSGILWMWIAIALISGLASLAGYGLFPRLRAGHRRVRSRLRGRSDPHDAGGNDDARGLRARRQAGRRHDDARIRSRVRRPHARLTVGAPHSHDEIA
jgi:ZIP family zinc transporter